MGNTESSSHSGPGEDKENLSSFPGSALVDALNCGGLDDTDDTPKSARGGTAKGGASHGNKSRKGANSGNGKAGKHGGGGGGGSSSHGHPLSAFFSKTEELCATSPTNSEFMQGGPSEFEDEYEEFGRDGGGTEDAAGGGGEGDGLSDHHTPPSRKRAPAHAPTDPTSALFAKAMVSEVTDNPNTMTPAAMAERERRLLKAQDKARKNKNNSGVRPVGVPGGVGRTSVLGSIAHALTGTTDPLGVGSGMAMMMSSNNSSLSSSHDNPAGASVLPPNSMSENRAAQAENSTHSTTRRAGRLAVTIGLSLSRRSPVGHPDTVTRQTAFDFNELQDREYKYVSSTDSSGWRAGGGEAGKPDETVDPTVEEGNPTIPSPGASAGFDPSSNGGGNYPGTPNAQENVKDAAPDTVHIPIIHIDAESQQAVDAIISAIASGEVFIPHMAIIPEALSVNGVSPPDLVVRFGTERNDDLNPDEWPNWCLEFMHNQLYEYFHTMGAQWMKRPFSITLAKKVRWKTVKHMNRYFAHAEGVIDAWREKGPQYLDPQLAYIEGGATPEEVARPHGIYLLRNGIPTNYFAPNFDPPYTTKMTRSLLLNVLGKSWDKKRREWTSQPIPRLVTPSMLMTAMCGCGESQAGGFVATEATLVNGTDGMDNSTLLPDNADIHSYDEKPSSTLRKKKERKQSTPKSNASSKRDNAYSTTELGNSPASQPNDRAESPNRLSRIASSEVENSYVEERLLAQPDHPLNRMVTEADRLNKSVDTQRKTSFSRTSGMDGDDLDVKLELQMSSASTSFDQSEANSTGNASSNNGRSALSAGSASSSKYGRPPTPEAFRSTRNALAPSLEEELMDRQQRHEKLTEQENKMAHLENSSAAFSVAAGSETVQPSETGTNSTIPRMNLSADKFIKKQKQSAENRGIDDDEKKEEDMRGPSALASDEDWLDELVSRMRESACTWIPFFNFSSTTYVLLLLSYREYHSRLPTGIRRRSKRRHLRRLPALLCPN